MTCDLIPGLMTTVRAHLLYYWNNTPFAVFEWDPKWFSDGISFYSIIYDIFYWLALAAHFYESLHYAMLELQYPD